MWIRQAIWRPSTISVSSRKYIDRRIRGLSVERCWNSRFLNIARVFPQTSRRCKEETCRWQTSKANDESNVTATSKVSTMPSLRDPLFQDDINAQLPTHREDDQIQIQRQKARRHSQLLRRDLRRSLQTRRMASLLRRYRRGSWLFHYSVQEGKSLGDLWRRRTLADSPGIRYSIKSTSTSSTLLLRGRAVGRSFISLREVLWRAIFAAITESASR